MAVLSNDTVRSDITEIVPAERFERALQFANLPEPVFLKIAWAEAVPSGVGSTCNLPSVSADSVPAGTKTEGDEFSRVTLDTSEATITSGYVGFGRFMSYEAINDAAFDIVAISTENAVRYLMDRLDADGFVLNDSLSSAETHAGAALTDEHVLQALTTYMLLDVSKGATKAIVLNPKQIGDWTKDLSQSGGAYLGGDAASASVAALIGPDAGFMGVKHGCQVWVSNNCPVAAGDATGALVPMGMLSPLALRSWAPLTIKQEDFPQRAGIDVWYSLRYGVALANQNGVKIISDGA
jgi:hypothetical protein